MNFRRRHLAASVLLAPAFAAAQMHHVDKPEQVTRAVGVYEWTGDLAKPTASRFVPVSVFINGRMQDAGIYLARPVPLALETGTVYEFDIAGSPKGTIDLNLARDVATQRDVADDNPEGSWYGYGPFAPPAPPKKSTAKPSVNLASVSGTQDDDRPHFVAPRPDASTSTPARKSTGSAPTADDDTERPTLRHRDDDPDDTPAKKPKKQKDGGYVTGVGNGLNDDPDRPTLGRSKAASEGTPPLEGLPEGLHQAVAVSDPALHDPHEFARAWENTEERDETLHALEALATKATQTYLITNALTPAPPAAEAALTDTTIAPPAPATGDAAPTLKRTPNGIDTATTPSPAPPKPATKSAARPTAKSKPLPTPALPIVFSDEQLHGYNLTYGGLPTFVYTAAMPVAPLKAATASLTLYIALVAQKLPSGDLQVSLTSVTDSGHLGLTPWMRFIDVVDPDGTHRASMLFELRQPHSRQFALYRLVSATADQTFATRLIE